MEKKNKKALKDLLPAIITIILALIISLTLSIISEKTHKASAETITPDIEGTESIYFWGKGGSIVYSNNVEGTNLYFESTLPQSVASPLNTSYYAIATTRTTYFWTTEDSVTGRNDYNNNPAETITERGTSTAIQYTKYGNSVGWNTDKIKISLKGRQALAYLHFQESLERTQIRVPAGSTATLQCIFVDYTTEETHNITETIAVDNWGGVWSYISGESLKNTFYAMWANLDNDLGGEVDSKLIFRSTNDTPLFLMDLFNITINISDNATSGIEMPFLLTYERNNENLKIGKYLEDTIYTQYVTFTDWGGETSLFGFVNTFFNTEIFEGFSFGTLITVGIGVTVLGIVLKVFLGG